MKKIILALVLLLTINSISFAQTSDRFQYVIIPTHFADISKDLNPYGISSTSLKILTKKNIKAVYKDNEKPSALCNGLVLDVQNKSTWLHFGVIATLSDCNNNIVWTAKGSSSSKEYNLGYKEAMEDAFKNLNELPISTNPTKADDVAAVRTPVVAVTTPATTGEDYTPQNIYVNDKYMLDVVPLSDGKKELRVINGSSLGYNKLQAVGTLLPTDAKGFYSVKWTTPKGETKNGTATLSDSKLTIKLSSSEAIELLKN